MNAAESACRPRCSPSFTWFVDDPDGGAILYRRGLSRVGPRQPIARVAVQHKAMVGVLAVGPKADRAGEVPGIHLALARPVSQVHGQEIRIRAVIHAADRFPEPVPGILV